MLCTNQTTLLNTSLKRVKVKNDLSIIRAIRPNFETMYSRILLILLLLSSGMCYAQSGVYIQVLGIAQDGGYPHIGCSKQCCAKAWENDTLKKLVTSLALVDSQSGKWWLLEASPDITAQLHNFQSLTKGKYRFLPDGVFLTHAHIGHYTGLAYFGREALNTHNVQVYAMPKMKEFLNKNGPWSQLALLKNINICSLHADSELVLTPNVSIIPFIVPHRDEFSETVGFKITTTNKKYLFVPDINKWNVWERSVVEEVKNVDIALIDGTFYTDNELPDRKMSEVPHPFIAETVHLFSNQPEPIRNKIHFIHFNHTNPLLWNNNKQKELQQLGYHITAQGERL